MLTDQEIHQAIEDVQSAGNAGSFVLAVGRAIESKVLEKREGLATKVQLFRARRALDLHKAEDDLLIDVVLALRSGKQ